MIKYLNDDGVRELSSLVNTDIQKVKNDLSKVSDSVNDLSNSVVEIKNRFPSSNYRYTDMYVNLYRVWSLLSSSGGISRYFMYFSYVDLKSGLAYRVYNTYSSSGDSYYVHNLYTDEIVSASGYFADWSPDRDSLLCTSDSNTKMWFYAIENDSIVSKYINLKSIDGFSNAYVTSMYFANPDYVFFLNDYYGYKPYILKVSDGTIYNILTDVFKGGVTLYNSYIRVVPCKNKNTMYIALRQSSSKYSFFMIKNLLQQNQEIIEFTPTANVGTDLTFSHFDVIDEDVIYSSSPNKIFILNRIELTIDMKNLDNVDSAYSIDKYFGCLKNTSKWTFYRYDRSKDALVPYKKIEPLPLDMYDYIWLNGCITLNSYIYNYNYSTSNEQFRLCSVSYAIDL